MFFFDSETHLIRPGVLAPKLVCVSYAHDSQPAELVLADEGADVVEEALDAGDILAGHNLPFDFAVLFTYRPRLLQKIFKAYREGRVRDTQPRQQLMDIQNGCLNYPRRDGTRGYSLAALEQHWLGKDRSDEKKDPTSWRFRYAELDGVPISQWPQAAIDYALEDTVGARDVYREQGAAYYDIGPENEWSSQAGLFPPLTDEVEQTRAAWCLHLCSLWGLKTNGKSVDELERDCIKRHAELQKKMLDEGLMKIRAATKKEREEGKFDGMAEFQGEDDALPFRYQKDMKAIRAKVELAYQAVGEKVPRTDPSETAPDGQVKTDAETLKYSGDAVLEELGEGGPISTILKTFVPALKRGTEAAINARFNVLVETGRPSCSDPNLYNIPRAGGVRECFEARPGYVFCSVDYPCAELRALAQVCLWLFGKSAMAEFFQKNPDGDPHLEMAAFVLGIEPAEAKRRSKLPCGSEAPILRAGGRLCLHCEVKDMRQMCKAFNFGFPGGMGVDTMISTARRQYGVVLTRARAQEGRQMWLNRWPEMRLYFDHINRLVGLGGATIMQLKPGGAPHRKRGDVEYKNGCNGFFQGLLADAFKHAMWLVTEEAWLDESSPLFGTRIVVPLYDELFAEIPEPVPGAAHAAAYRLAEVQSLGARTWIPDVPMPCAPALMYRWSKSAEERFDEHGKLIAFDAPRERAAA